jgi:tRNA-2-methylthio-N6-dimethylallyladenosine synthase
MKSKKRNVFIKTFGCQANFYDSARLEELFGKYNYMLVPSPAEADVIIMNTCHIREKAGEKMFSELGKLQQLKSAKRAQGSYMVVVVTGCAAKAERENIFKRAPLVDLVVDSDSQHHLGNLVEEVFTNFYKGISKKLIKLDAPKEEKFKKLEIARKTRSICETVVIQDGCNKFCTYCTVPLVRGREYSRPANDVVKEIGCLVADGAREITLLGQNVNDYQDSSGGCGIVTLAELLHRISQIPHLKRIRYLTSYPSQWGEDLLLAHKELFQLMPFIHLPVQSGSNKILKSMHRPYSREQYLNLVAHIQECIPSIVFASDFIVGFPGDTEEDFQETLQLISQINYGSSFSFGYSPRPSTIARDLADQVPENIKKDRLLRLQTALAQKQLAFNSSFVGKIVTILVEKELSRVDSLFFGRTIYQQDTIFIARTPPLLGDLVNVIIQEATRKTLRGLLV